MIRKRSKKEGMNKTLTVNIVIAIFCVAATWVSIQTIGEMNSLSTKISTHHSHAIREITYNNTLTQQQQYY